MARVNLESEQGDNILLRFEVQDTGIGLSEANQLKIFESFRQADDSTTRKYGGTGLGLSISKQLTYLMRGEIGVDSTLGKGSTFWFTARVTKNKSMSIVSDYYSEYFCGQRVLIVDDNTTNLNMLQQQIKARGLEAFVASSGSQALDLLYRAIKEQQAYDLILLDQDMPIMGGLVLARIIQAAPELPTMPVILLTSVGHEDFLEQEQELGIRAQITKPVRQLRLFEKIGEVFGLPSQESMPPTETENRPLQARVLLAEDNPVNQEVAKNMLQNLGCHVTIAENGTKTLEAIAQTDYDLVLMDCLMPELDGFETTRRLRLLEQETNRHIPIIALTANTSQEDQKRCLKAGMDDFLSKPFEQKQLRAVLDYWLNQESTIIHKQEIEPANESTEEQLDKILDQKALDQIRALQQPGKPDLLKKVVAIYLKTAPGLLQNLQDATAANDAEAFYKAAHSLKSSSANLGADSLAAIAKELEMRGRQQSMEGIEILLTQMEKSYSTVKLELETNYL